MNTSLLPSLPHLTTHTCTQSLKTLVSQVSRQYNEKIAFVAPLVQSILSCWEDLDLKPQSEVEQALSKGAQHVVLSQQTIRVIEDLYATVNL